MTYEQLAIPGYEKSELIPSESRSCLRASPVNLTALRERVEAMATSVTCGAKLSDVSAKLSRDGSSVKIRSVCLPELIKGTSSEYLPTLPKWGTACHGEYGELAMSAHLTSESGCSCALGTPTASMTKRSRKFMRKTKQPAEFVEIFPTPTVCGNNNRKGASKTSGNGLATIVGGKLNPMWVEWLMAFPLGWTDLDA